MSFNPDPIEKTQEVVFTRKISKEEHRPFLASEVNSQKQLRYYF